MFWSVLEELTILNLDLDLLSCEEGILYLSVHWPAFLPSFLLSMYLIDFFSLLYNFKIFTHMLCGLLFTILLWALQILGMGLCLYVNIFLEIYKRIFKNILSLTSWPLKGLGKCNALQWLKSVPACSD